MDIFIIFYSNNGIYRIFNLSISLSYYVQMVLLLIKMNNINNNIGN